MKPCNCAKAAQLVEESPAEYLLRSASTFSKGYIWGQSQLLTKRMANAQISNVAGHGAALHPMYTGRRAGIRGIRRHKKSHLCRL